MQADMTRITKNHRWIWAICLLLATAAGLTLRPWKSQTNPAMPQYTPVSLNVEATDPFKGAVAWLNTGGPIKLSDLKGKIVILDFWTYCCINCHHILPNLAKLEEKYPNELVVIGVHTPKFLAEEDTQNIRSKVREYNIKHPIINDRDRVVWETFGVNSWPTLVVLGPDGKLIARNSGEVTFEILDAFMQRVLEKFKGQIDVTPVKFFPENEKPDETPLLFPGKVVADTAGKRLFVSDTGHNRIVMTDLEGKNPVVIGSGTAGLADGSFEKAMFDRPQGTALVGDTLYVADTETVATIAGIGSQAQRDPGDRTQTPAKNTALNSPWDLAYLPAANTLYIAMAGPHQIWQLNLETGLIGVYAGSGRENIVDGSLEASNFAQPSGLATDGNTLFIADSEVSALREIHLNQAENPVETIVGEGLFEFGDKDGAGPGVRLQHCLGVAFADGKLYVADTYNNRVKVCDPKAKSVKAFVGTHEAGDGDKPAKFYQPAGLSVAGDKLYVADTNNHKIRVVSLATQEVATLPLEGLAPPAPPARKPTFPNAKSETLAKAELAAVGKLEIDVKLPIAEGYTLNEQGSIPVLVETPGKTDILGAAYPKTGEKISPPVKEFSVKVPLAKALAVGDAFDLKVSVSTFVCNKGSGFCTIKSHVWTVPVTVTEAGAKSLKIAP